MRRLFLSSLAIFGSSETGNKTRLANIMMQLRKAIGHPYLFPGLEPEPFEMGEHLGEYFSLRLFFLFTSFSRSERKTSYSRSSSCTFIC
jgi:hypothetical protein